MVQIRFKLSVKFILGSSQNLIPKKKYIFPIDKSKFQTYNKNKKSEHGLTTGKRPLRRWHFRAVGELWFYQ